MLSVLVTGATGGVARGVLSFLEPHFGLRLLAPDVPEEGPRFLRGDILDLGFLTRALHGIEAVLHLAVAAGHTGTYEDDAFNDLRFDVNVKGTHHVFEAARRAGVRRVVQVSSLMVTWGHALAIHRQGPGTRVPGDAPPRPVGTYALTKALGEEVARHYAECHELEVITVRIAAPVDLGDPELPRKTLRPQQVPFPDLAQASTRALTVPLEKYEVVSVCGHSASCLWDLGAARRVLGYEPQYCLDELGIPLAGPFDVEER